MLLFLTHISPQHGTPLHMQNYCSSAKEDRLVTHAGMRAFEIPISLQSIFLNRPSFYLRHTCLPQKNSDKEHIHPFHPTPHELNPLASSFPRTVWEKGNFGHQLLVSIPMNQPVSPKPNLPFPYICISILRLALHPYIHLFPQYSLSVSPQ